MANRTIPLHEQRLVLRRLAEGYSTRQAIAGTSIKSNQTAARLARSYSHTIKQYRMSYLEKIEATQIGSLNNRAQVIGEMVEANKFIKISLPQNRSSFVPHDKKEVFFQVPDWGVRLKAIKYIDELTGIVPKEISTNTHINVMQQFNRGPD